LLKLEEIFKIMSITNTSEIPTFESFCFKIGHFIKIDRYLNTFLKLNGLITTFICMLVFIRLLKHERQQNSLMFKYYLLKSILECFALNLMILVTFLLFLNYSYIWNLMYLWFFGYVSLSFISISSYLEFMALFDCYISLSNRFNALKTKKSFYIFVSIITIYIFFMNSFYNVIKKINVENHNGTNVYQIANSKNFFNDNYKLFNSLITINREFLPFILILFINILILSKIRRISEKKKELKLNNHGITIDIDRNKKILDAELNKIKMTVCSSVTFVLCRVPSQIAFMYYDRIDDNKKCLIVCFLGSLYYMNYLPQIVFYYFFNKLFQKHFNQFFKFQ
jgi:hypothetical protein